MAVFKTAVLPLDYASIINRFCSSVFFHYSMNHTKYYDVNNHGTWGGIRIHNTWFLKPRPLAKLGYPRICRPRGIWTHHEDYAPTDFKSVASRQFRHRPVDPVGIEPTILIRATAFETVAYANSATSLCLAHDPIRTGDIQFTGLAFSPLNYAGTTLLLSDQPL